MAQVVFSGMDVPRVDALLGTLRENAAAVAAEKTLVDAVWLATPSNGESVHVASHSPVELRGRRPTRTGGRSIPGPDVTRADGGRSPRSRAVTRGRGGGSAVGRPPLRTAGPFRRSGQRGGIRGPREGSSESESSEVAT